MPSHWLLDVQDRNYPAPSQYSNINLGAIDRSIVTRYYSQFTSWLRAAGIIRPTEDPYRDIFNIPIQATFVADTITGSVLHPPSGQRWLVFIHTRDAPVRCVLARYIVEKGLEVRVFGDSPAGIVIEPTRGNGVHGVGVPLDRIHDMVREGVELL
jgi:hypothetical protein